MRLLAVASVFLILLVFIFFSSCVYHFHLVDSLRETEKECLTESRDRERTDCLAEVEQTLVVKYYVKWVLFVSGISGFILVMVVVYLAWKDWQRRKDKHEMDLNAYRQQLDAKERMEAEFRSKVGHYKDDVENVIEEYQRGWQEAQREAAFLNMRIQRQNVKDRSNWAKITQLRKREGTSKKELEAKSKINKRLARELERKTEDSERLARELERKTEDSERLARELERKTEDSERFARELERKMEDSERLTGELSNERRGKRESERLTRDLSKEKRKREREMENLRLVISEKEGLLSNERRGKRESERLTRDLSKEKRKREREMENLRLVVSEKEGLLLERGRETENLRQENERLRNEPEPSVLRRVGEFFGLM